MAAKRKVRKSSHKKEAKTTVSAINEQISMIEKEASDAYRKLQAFGAHASENWQDWIKKLPSKDVMSFASFKKKYVYKEVKRLSDEIVKNIQKADIFANQENLINDAKSILDELVDKIQKSDIVTKFTETAAETKKEVLSFLNIPSQGELLKLQKKLHSLEKRVNSLTGK